ncbi:unnamed protein product [Rotaria sp. Silwood1]|nr:unnamed protein product [Rotaria sp. Silwood1]
MESENDNGFTLVKRKKKKKKIDLQQNQKSSSSSSSCSSSPTSSTNGSTSSTNTNSIINHVQPTSAVAIHLQPNSLEVNAPVSTGTTYLTTHYSYNYNSNLNFAGHRLKFKRDLLLFVNDRESFSMLYDASKWPSTIESLNFEKILPNHLPHQFSLVLKNVPSDIEIDTLLTNIKSIYPDVMNAHRILNKNQHPTTLVRLDINNINVIDELVGVDM